MARTPKLDTYAKQQAYKAWQAEQAAALAAGSDDPDGQDSEMNENERANANIYEPGSFGDQNYRANRATVAASASAAYRGPGNQNEYPGANPSQLAALAKKPGERSLQEKNDLRIRARAEEIALKRGQKIQGGGISQDLIAEDVGGSVGRREAKAALAYQNASESTMADAGRGANGEKKTRMPSFSTPAVTPGGQDNRPAPGSPGFSPTGYALRQMADGTFRGATPDGNGGTALRNFSTQAEALAYYRPPAPPPIDSAGMGQRAAAGQPMFQQPGSPAAATPQPFQAAYQAGMPAPAPTTMQTAEAAKTTSPTTKLQMNAPAPGAVPAVAPSPAPAPAPAPANPFGTFAAPNPEMATKAPDGSVSPTASGVDFLRKRAADTNRELGTPKRAGYQAIAKELNPFGN